MRRQGAFFQNRGSLHAIFSFTQGFAQLRRFHGPGCALRASQRVGPERARKRQPRPGRKHLHGCDGCGQRRCRQERQEEGEGPAGRARGGAAHHRGNGARDPAERGDALLLTQMLVNLLENALHHTPQGTPVSVKLAATEQGYRLIIEDAGAGIPPQERSRVLKRFVRLDAARSSPGSGLGLSLVAAVADLHGIALALDDADPGLRVQLDFHAQQSA